MDSPKNRMDGLPSGTRVNLDSLTTLVRGDGYPPFNVERLLGGESDRLRITLAVAGFAENELEVEIAGTELSIRGRQSERGDVTYLFQGIAARQFQRVFLLAPGSEVLSARMRQGLLIIELHRPQPLQKVRKINISASQ